jgi:hypothetical protein
VRRALGIPWRDAQGMPEETTDKAYIRVVLPSGAGFEILLNVRRRDADVRLWDENRTVLRCCFC